MIASDILLVDDDPDLLKLISLRLTSAGYRVYLTFEGGLHRDEFDPVVTQMRVVSRAHTSHVDDGAGVVEADNHQVVDSNPGIGRSE